MKFISSIFENLSRLTSAEIIWSILIIYLVRVIILICICIVKYAIWRRKISKLALGSKMRFFNLLGHVSYLPFTKKSRNGQPFLACAQQMLLGVTKLLEQEKLFCLWVFFHPVIVLSKAEAIEVIYSGMNTIEKPVFYRWILLVGDGLVTSSGDRWKSQRKMLNPCFRPDILKEHLHILNKQSQILAERLKAETDKDFTSIYRYLSDCAFDIICEIIYGVEMGAQQSKKETAAFVYSAGRGFRLIMRRFFNPFLWPDFLFYSSKTGKEMKKHSQVVNDFVRDLIEKEKRNFLEHPQINERKGKSLVKLLLNQYYLSKDMSEEDIRDELVTFMIAGHDTTKIASSWILYMLGLHADILAKVHEELDWIFGEDRERHATLEDLNNMKYLNCVIKETLRLYPPVPVLSRQLNDDTTICGHQIPKGTTCLVLTHVLHRDEVVFPNPEKFDPDRFRPENCATRHPYAWIPFSAGPRNCIGKKLASMELLTITSTVLRRYTVESLDPRDKVLPMLTIGLASSMPLRIRIRPRYPPKI